jgi:Cu(I)/Ag(I) efflux system membrane fusion protein
MVEGGNVKAGEPLAWIYSPEFISAQNEYLLARRTVRSLSNQATTDLLEDAKATLDGSRNKLRILGASNAEVSILDQKGIAQEYMAITSPINGKVTKRNVDPGGYLEMGSSLGSVADMSSLWFLGNVFEADLPKLMEGQIAIIRVKGLNVNETYKGRISFISPIVDPDTHGVVVRVDLPNGNQQLKPDMFARAEIDVGIRKLPVVPRSAVVQDGAESFVVRKKTDGSFERISVSVTTANDPYLLAITSGLSTNDQVVTEGGVLVDRALINEAKLKAMSNQSKIKSNEVKP